MIISVKLYTLALEESNYPYINSSGRRVRMLKFNCKTIYISDYFIFYLSLLIQSQMIYCRQLNMHTSNSTKNDTAFLIKNVRMSTYD